MLFPLDDDYVTLHNARALLTGIDPNYGVSPLVGATSPIHLALVAGLGLVLPLPLASILINLIGAVLYGLGLWRMAALGGASRPTRLAIVGVGLAVAIPHLMNGLETGLALAGVAWSLVLAARGSPILLPLLVGSLPFLRPDLAPWSAALLLWRAWRAGVQETTWRAGARRLGLDLGLAALAAAPWLAWSWISLGSLVPNTMMAKRAFFAEEGFPFWAKAELVIRELVGSLLAPLAVGLVVAWRAALAPPIGAALAAFLIAYTLTFPGGLAHNNYRYLALVAPFLLYGVAYAAVRHERLARIGLATLLILAAPIGVWRLYQAYAVTADGVAASRWAGEHLPPDARVLIHDAGSPAWETELRLIDVVGLKRPESIAEHERWTAPSRGVRRDEAVNRIALAAHVTHAIVLDDGFWGEIADDLKKHGWRLDLLRQPAVSPGYWVYALTPPLALGQTER